MLKVLPTMAADSVHAVVCDPPYHLTSTSDRFGSATAAPAKFGTDGAYARASRGFMGQTWDGGDIAMRPETWGKVLRVMKPGAHLVAFGGSRTYHRIACAIEDAGFELRDSLMWLYGSGFPKSHDVSKGINATLLHGTARTEDIRRMRMGDSYVPSGRGRVNYDNGGGSKMGSEKIAAVREAFPDLDFKFTTPEAAEWEGWGTALKPSFEPIILARKPLAGTVAANTLLHRVGGINIDGCRVPYLSDETHDVRGRFPANTLHDGSDEVLEAFAAFGTKTSGKPGVMRKGKNDGACYGAESRQPGTRMTGFGDSGSAARFFMPTSWTDEEWNSYINANGAGSIIDLQSGHAASALGLAVARSMQGSALILAGYQAPSMSVTLSELRQISEAAIMVTQSIASACSRGAPPERLSLSTNHAKCVAISNPTGTIQITISLLRSNGYVEPVIFSITSQRSELGAKGFEGSRFHYCAKASKADRAGSNHPTVKPIALMQWLARLVTPPGGVVLDPFAGSGSTGAACVREGFDVIMVEQSADYVADICRRMTAIGK